jgi:hypothetical protein
LSEMKPELLQLQLSDLGKFPACPHANTQVFDGRI